MTDATVRDPALLDEWTAIFHRVAGAEGVISREVFKKTLMVKDEYLARRLFDLFDEDGNGTIDYGEFIRALSSLLLGEREAKLDFAFRLHDRDGNGAIDRDELRTLIEAGLAECGLDFSPTQTGNLVNALFERADENGDGDISFEEFRHVLEQYPQVYEQMTISAAAWLAPLRGRRRRKPRAPRRAAPRKYVQAGATTVVFLVLYGLANAALFANAMVQYAESGIFVMVARGCGACLNFNGALILIPMMRHLITWLRRTFVYKVVPLDQSVDFHRLVGHAMFGFAVVHTGAHLANYTTLERPVMTSLLQTWAGATGLALMVVFAAMWSTSRAAVRRRGGFELFFYVHLGFIPWFVLAFLHGPVFWQWATLPLVGYGVERLLRARSNKDPSYVVRADTLAEGVTYLELNRPGGFHYSPGDYLFLLIPQLSKYEWHPFTISSCPEDEAHLTVHIRSLGNWTSRLYALCKARGDAEVLEPLPVYIDGPYGTPSTQVFESTHAILIGAGIGVTPFASILQSILKRRAAAGLAHLQKVHFYWVNRGQYSFEWFTDLLGDIEAADVGDVIDANIYLSSAKLDLKSTTLNIAMDLTHAETGRDLITGLQLRTRFGRPDWGEIFAELAARYDGEKVDVFFCGPAALSRALSKEARKNGFTYRKENF